MRYTIAGRNDVKCKDTTLGAPALGGFDVFGVFGVLGVFGVFDVFGVFGVFGVFSDGVLVLSTSSPVPGYEHPPPEQSRLHFCPSQCSLQFPPGHDISHISAPVSQYILQFPLVHDW